GARLRAIVETREPCCERGSASLEQSGVGQGSVDVVDERWIFRIDGLDLLLELVPCRRRGQKPVSIEGNPLTSMVDLVLVQPAERLLMAHLLPAVARDGPRRTRSQQTAQPFQLRVIRKPGMALGSDPL